MSSEGSTSARRRGNPAGGKDCKPHFSKDMSQGKSVVLPPFLSSGKKKTGSVSASIPKVPNVIQKIQDPPARTNEAPSKRAKKDGQQDGSSQFVPKNFKEGTYAQHLFATLGSKFAGEAEPATWFKATPSENAEAVTRCLDEAFIRQASHTQSYKTLEKKVAVLEYQKVEDKRSLEKTYKQDLQRETASLRTDLKNAKQQRNAFEKQLAEAQELAKKVAEETKAKHDAEIAKLKGELDSATLELSTAEEKFLAQGQVFFMKGFIRKIPDFDWDRLGEGNADFAAALHKEIEAEDAEEARLLEAEKLIEETKLAAEAAKANQDISPP